MSNLFPRFSVTLTLSVLLLCINLQAQPRRPMAPADILRIAAVSDAQISPNGLWVVYTVSSVADDKSINTLWLARAATEPVTYPTKPPSDSRGVPYVDWPESRTAATPLLPAGWNASIARWSPDSSTIAFISNHDEQEGLWTVKIDRREPRFVTAVQSTNFFITYAGEVYSWSPDSKRIAYISATVETPEGVAGARADDPRVIDRIQYKSRTSFSDNKRTHVWVVDVERPEPRQLTSGSFYDHSVNFSPRGDEIVFLSNRESDPDANNNSDIFAVDIGGQVRQITDTKGCEYDPLWSPDGKWIAYTATKRDVTTIDSVAEDTHLWVIPASGGAGKEIGVEQDRRFRNALWSPDSRSIYALAGDRGYSTIFRAGVDGGKVSRFSLFTYEGQLVGGFDIEDSKSTTAPGPPFQISGFSISGRAAAVRSGSDSSYPLVFTLSTALRPAEVWFSGANNARIVRLSAHNDSFVRSTRFTLPEEFTFSSFDGTTIQAWIMRGTGCREDRKCPLILSVHGGPHGMFGWSFNPNFQVFAARNFSVLYLNPRGSSGYGQKFSDGTINEWGGGDYKDLMLGVDEALRRYSWIDPNRLGVTGGSYGGFMTNWIITQTPRFKAAVASASLSNLISFYSTSLYQDLIHAEFGGFPWDNFELLWQWSPLRYVRQVQTPTMFLHGENDNDVHITQAEEMYMALKRRGIDSVLVRYPREGHGLREPKHRVDALERTLAWFEKYLH
ncbi:MAG TPA: S9 family peptidase [Pyrinomonadaceae bacterium]|nr:S9 family peptidase [Pyrinomonadaceae bacterium]